MAWRCRLQALSGLDKANADDAISAVTQRLQDITRDEAQAQGAIVIKLSCKLWEPLQTVSATCRLRPQAALNPKRKLFLPVGHWDSTQ